jgi:hypothetical protein
MYNQLARYMQVAYEQLYQRIGQFSAAVYEAVQHRVHCYVRALSYWRCYFM